MYRLKGEIAEVKDVMRNNINKVLERGEKIELLVDKSEALAESATVFHKRAKTLKWAMCRENAKLWAIIIFVVVAVITVIVLVACGGKCGGSPSPSVPASSMPTSRMRSSCTRCTDKTCWRAAPLSWENCGFLRSLPKRIRG